MPAGQCASLPTLAQAVFTGRGRHVPAPSGGTSGLSFRCLLSPSLLSSVVFPCWFLWCFLEAGGAQQPLRPSEGLAGVVEPHLLVAVRFPPTREGSGTKCSGRRPKNRASFRYPPQYLVRSRVLPYLLTCGMFWVFGSFHLPAVTSATTIKPQKIASSSPISTVPYSGTSSFHHRGESWVCRPAQSTSCRRSSMRKWRNFTSLHSTVLTQKQEDNIGVKVEGPLKGGHYRFQVSRFIRLCCHWQRVRGLPPRLQKKSIWANSPRIELECGTTRHESSIAKNYFEIELDREELFAIELDLD